MSWLKDLGASLLGGAPGALASLGVGVIQGISSNAAQKSANETNMAIANANNQTSIDIANANRQAQIDMMRENNQFSRQMAIDMFNMENAYNSPIELVKRLEEAGINPAVYFGQGSGSVASADASSPSAAGSTISSSLPSLTTPNVQAAPPVVSGFLDALQQLANMQLAGAQARKAGKEADWIDETAQATIKKVLAEAEGQDLKNTYQEVENILQELTFDSRAKQPAIALLKLHQDYMVAKATEADRYADKLLKDMQRLLEKTNLKILKAQAPFLIENVKKEGQLIDAKRETERSQQDKNRAETRSINILNEVLPEKYANEITIGQAETIDKIINAGSAHNKYELINQLVNAGIHRDAAEAIADHRDELIKRMEKVK